MVASSLNTPIQLNRQGGVGVILGDLPGRGSVEDPLSWYNVLLSYSGARFPRGLLGGVSLCPHPPKKGEKLANLQTYYL